jgi:hypothetical protein
MQQIAIPELSYSSLELRAIKDVHLKPGHKAYWRFSTNGSKGESLWRYVPVTVFEDRLKKYSGAYYPIHLTPELMRKIGFNEIGDGYIEYNGVKLAEYLDDGSGLYEYQITVGFDNGETRIKVLRALHELQNMFIDVLNKSLPI